MSLYDDASLVMIPSGYKDGKLYSVKPSDGAGDFTFTRGSNLAATRVDENGLIEKGRENLLLQSNQFDTNWTTSNASVTGGQTGYDGSSNAWLLQASGTTSYLIQNISASNGYVYTQSIYAKSGNTDFISLTFGSGMSTKYAIFNLSNGSIDTDTGFIDSTIQSVGSGWYRCSISVSSSATGSNGGLIATPSRSGASRFAAVVGDNVLIQSAQTEAGLVATDYIETGATTAQAGILEDMPRLDYSGGACPALLLEPQRTNLCRDSEYMTGTGWTAGYTVNSNAIVAPDGTQTATEVVIPAGFGQLRFDSTVSASTQYAFTFYVKNATASELKYSVFDFSNTSNIIASTSYFSQVSTTEWVRVEVLFTTPSGCTSVGCYLDRDSQGDGTVYFWGAQLEEGSYPTSYIPTYGTSVTRSGERCINASASSIIGQSQGSLFLEYDNTNTNSLGGQVRASINSSGLSDWIFLGEESGNYRMYFRVNGSVLLNNQAAPANGINKLCIAYNESGDIRMFFNGSKLASYSNAFNFNGTITTIEFGNGGYTVSSSNAFKQYHIFPTALTDSECIALTTL